MSKKAYRIAQVGTFDCKNYGDILFPDVLSTELPKYLNVEEIVLFSPIGGNKPFDHREVLPISELEQEHLSKPFDAIVCGGGDIVRLDRKVVGDADKYNMENSAAELWVPAVLLGSKYHIPVVFNAPGVPFHFVRTEQEYVKILLDMVDYLCVRDVSSRDILQECTSRQINVRPDSIFLALQTYDKERLDLVFNDCCKELQLPERYVLFQCNGIEGGMTASEYDEYLALIEKWTNAKCLLMPIGYVHQDWEVLESIKQEAQRQYQMIHKELSPEEMLAVIGHAVAFVGTSMHGCLTAMIQDVPAIAINSHCLTKMKGLYQMAALEKAEIISIKRLRKEMLQYVIDSQMKERLKEQANEHIRAMADVIREGKKNAAPINEMACFMTELVEKTTVTNNSVSKVYWSEKQQFDEFDSRSFSIDPGEDEIEISIDLPLGTKLIRFDPVEGSRCAIADLCAEDASGRKLSLMTHNGRNVDEYILFDTLDPQITLTFDGELCSPVRIGCKYLQIPENDILADLYKKEIERLEAEYRQREKVQQIAIESLQNQFERLEAEYRQREKVQQIAIESLQNQFNEVTGSFAWRMTALLRRTLDYLKTTFRNTPLRPLYRALKYMKRYGLKATAKRVIYRIKAKYVAQRGAMYSKEELKKERETVFPQNVKFSIVVPLYNTPEKYLREMIQSVIDQTYGNWELCMADGSDAQHPQVQAICRSYSKKDSRIRYVRLDKNLGISGNTNACIDMAQGEYIGLFDHDDLLHPSALYEIMWAICDKNADFVYTDETTFSHKPKDAFRPHFKPDYAPDTLRSYNYICHFTVFKASLLAEIGGGFRPEFDGSQDYDLILRLTEKAKHIVHIPKILYYWRSHENSVASDISAKPYTMVAAKNALKEHLERIGLEGEVFDAQALSMYRIKYKIRNNDLISILIPNRDHIDDLSKCIESIRSKSTYRNWEIIVIENNSIETETFAYYKKIQEDWRIRVVTWSGEFNYSAINNFGAQFAKGGYILLLNNDIEIITPDWLEQMLMFAQREDVGAVGSMLYYPDNTIQHAGVILGIGGVAGHSHKYFPRGDYGYMGRLILAQNLSAVTAACMLMRKAVWDEVNGLDEGFKVAFNDVDLCMRIRKKNYLIVWTPFAEMYHYESKSRGLEDTKEKQMRFKGEVERFMARWSKELEEGDPYYNPNLTLRKEDFSGK